MKQPPNAACTLANAQAIAEFAEETDAEVMRGALRYPSESGGWQLGASTLASTLRTKSAMRRWTMSIVVLAPVGG